MTDAIVVGSGPNGLVAANLLADEGWGVLVLEASSSPGGAVKSSELIEPGFVNDHCSAFYPLAATSPVIDDLGLDEFGLRWCRSPRVLAHPSRDGTCPSISMNLEATAACLDAFARGDGDAWIRLYELWKRAGDQTVDLLFTPFPPVKAGLKMATAMPWRDLVRFARFSALPVRRLSEEQFRSDQARRLLPGLALHADFSPESSLSGFFGWLLGSLGQEVGFPAPEGGAGELSGAMVRRLASRGGTLLCDQRVDEILVRAGRVAGVRTGDGEVHSAKRAVLADVDAVTLYERLIPSHAVPAAIRQDIARFEWDDGTFKVDWTLDGPIPWSAPEARQAGVIHVAESLDELSLTASELASGLLPTDPFLLLGQQSMVDPTRAPVGKETAWAYTHVPLRARGDRRGLLTGSWNTLETEAFVERMEDRVEALAPGFRDLVRGRHVFTPARFENENSNLVGGALGGGTTQLHQQLLFRPTPGLGRPATTVAGLYLASASAHPGGGVHGACGANAARAAIRGWQHRRVLEAVRWVSRRAQRGVEPSAIP